MDEPILDYVLQQLSIYNGQRRQICEDTGIQYTWLSKLAVGQIPNPGVNQIQKLYDYFKNKEGE